MLLNNWIESGMLYLQSEVYFTGENIYKRSFALIIVQFMNLESFRRKNPWFAIMDDLPQYDNILIAIAD